MNKFKITFRHLNRILALDDENATATRLLQTKHNRRMKLHDRAKKFIKSMLKENVSPIQSSDIQKSLLSELKLRVSRKTINMYQKKKGLDMSYKKIRTIDFRHNLHGSKLQRQYAARHYVRLLDSGINIINIDESIIN